jgi:hypothetical protein
MNTTALQPLVFLSCLGAGVFAAMLYGALYVVRLIAKGKRAVDLVCDVLFVSLSAVAYFLVLFYTGFGEMRFYTVAAFLGGFFALYALLYPLGDKVKAKLAQGKEHLLKRKPWGKKKDVA